MSDKVGAPAMTGPQLRYSAGLTGVVAVCSFLLGAFGPTSPDGILRPVVSVAYSVLAVVVLMTFRMVMPAPSPLQILGALLFGAGLLLGTATSPFTGEYSPGLVPSFVGVALILVATPPVISERGCRAIHRTIWVTSIVYIVWTVGILGGITIVQGVTIRVFPAYYQELVQALVVRVRHPVGAWATHSAAALFYFLLALYFHKDATTTGRRGSGVLSVFWMVALFSLRSFSGLFLGLWILGIHVLPRVVRGWQTNRALARRLAASVIAMVCVAGIVFHRQLESMLVELLNIDVSGFSGRYSGETGRIYRTVVWLRDNPFRPIGFSETDILVYGDSAYVDYFLRGNLLSVAGVYLGLIVGTNRFIGRTRVTFHLLAAIMAFDLGFSGLPIWRVQLIWVPFLIALATVGRSEWDPKHRDSNRRVWP